MSPKGAKSALITSAMVVAGIRLYLQIRGKTTTPLQEWVVGWGATFFILALLSDAAPSAAGSLSILIAFSDFLINGVALTTDLEDIVTGAAGGNGLLVDNPLSGTASSTTSTTTGNGKNANQTAGRAATKTPTGKTPTGTGNNE